MDPFKQRLCIWAGPLSVVCAMAGLSFTGFSLPMSSELTPAQVVAFYREHLAGIRIAGAFFMFCSALMMIFAAAISAQLQRIEGRVTPWVFVQLIGGVMGNIPFALTGIIWTTTAFRPDRSPEIMQAMNDLAAFVLELPAPTAILQFLAIIFIVLGDKSEEPIFPKWVAYLNIIVSIMFLPGVAAGILVNSKAMDWNGFVSYSMPGIASSSWVILMFFALLRTNRRPI
jgi:hypothetical protein